MVQHSNEKTESSEDPLNHAMAAAFGPATDGGGRFAGRSAPSVMQRLSDRYGIQSRVLLRESSEEEIETVVIPTPAIAKATAGDATERYQVFGEIARGGMGIVMKGRDVDLGRDVAIKVLQQDLADRPQMVQRFVEEAQIAGQLQHPGILPVYELGMQSDARPFFTMRLIKGRTLAEILDERANVNDDRARLLKTFEQVCQTVAYAHTRGVVHRDLKPANIMVGAFGEVQVVDWGLAKVIRAGGSAGEHPTARGPVTKIETVRTARPGSGSLAGSVMGTPGYMSPEQARGEVENIDERADVYALGAILWEVLTGAPPSSEADLHHHAAGDLDVELVELAERCLSPMRGDRPRNAKVVADTVGAYLTSLEQRAHEASVQAAEARARAEEERRRRRLTIALASIIVVSTLAVALGAGWAYKERQQRRADALAQLSVAVSDAGERFGTAQATRIHNDAAWNALEAASQRVRNLLDTVEPESTIAGRAQALLDEIDDRARQRHLAVTIENVVIYGASHYDADSWLRMERDLRAVLLEFGIDLENMSKEEIARRIREDNATFELADGLELWLGTVGSLLEMGEVQMTLEEFVEWLETLYAADPDPLRTKVRQLVYAALFMEPVDRDEVQQLFESLSLEEVHPRTLAWLATVYFVLNDVDGAMEVLRRVTDVHPTDFGVMHDAAFSCASLEQWQPAVRYLLRCISIRPDVAGIWRQLGTAYRNTNELVASIEAFDRSVALDPQHGPTYIDRAETRLARGEHAMAIADAEKGMRLSEAANAQAWFVIGKTHFAEGEFAEALAAFDNCSAAAPLDKRFTEPIDEWINRTQDQLRDRR